MPTKEDMAITLANTLIIICITVFIISFLKRDLMNFATSYNLYIKSLGFAGIIYALVSFKNKKEIQ